MHRICASIRKLVRHFSQAVQSAPAIEIHYDNKTFRRVFRDPWDFIGYVHRNEGVLRAECRASSEC